jgi:hypothetical protein
MLRKPRRGWTVCHFKLKEDGVKTMRYRTWRRSIAIGALLLMLFFVLPMFLRAEGLRTACEILFWTTLVVSVGFQLTIAVLRKLGVLGFSYTDADRNSYLYNMEPTHRQMRDFRRRKKND